MGSVAAEKRNNVYILAGFFFFFPLESQWAARIAVERWLASTVAEIALRLGHRRVSWLPVHEFAR